MTEASCCHWDVVSFGEVVDHSAFGPRFSGDLYTPEGNVATLRTTDLDDHGRISYETMPLARLDEDRFAGHVLRPGDLVVTRSGTCGIAAVFEGFSLPVLPGAFLIRFRLKECAVPKYFRYYFNSPRGRANVLSIARGAVQQNINITNFEALRVPLPPLPAQEAITRVLAAYDDLIENNRRRMALLEEAARQLYREWFVRLRFPGHEHTRISDGVPEGWDRKPLGGVLTLNYGKALKEDNRSAGPVPVYGSSGVVGRHSQALVEGQGIIVGRKGNVGSIFWSDRPFWPIDTVYYVHPASSDFFLYHALKEIPFQSSDVAVPGLNRDYAHSLKIVVPPRTIRVQFEEIVAPMFVQIAKLGTHSEKLREARDLLLPRLMSGEIAV